MCFQDYTLVGLVKYYLNLPVFDKYQKIKEIGRIIVDRFNLHSIHENNEFLVIDLYFELQILQFHCHKRPPELQLGYNKLHNLRCMFVQVQTCLSAQRQTQSNMGKKNNTLPFINFQMLKLRHLSLLRRYFFEEILGVSKIGFPKV